MSRVLRIPQHGDADKYVLVHVSSSGKAELDLKLVGTEGNAPYFLSCKPQEEQFRNSPEYLTISQSKLTVSFSIIVKHNRSASLKTKNCPCSQNDWDNILSMLLLGKPVEDEEIDVYKGLEIIADVEDQVSISLTIRKRIEGITVSNTSHSCFTTHRD